MGEYINLLNISLVLLAYLIGSVPSAVWVGKYFFNTDVRNFGSLNSGATNTFRVLGYKAGIPVLLMDVSKGWFCVYVLSRVGTFDVGSIAFINLQLVIGCVAVLGHIFPIYENFKGGKGVATLLGIVLAVHLQAALICIAIFIVLFLLTRYVSLGSIIAGVSFPALIILVFKPEALSLIYFSIAFGCIVLITHQKNIGRLIRKEENKMDIGLRNKKNND